MANMSKAERISYIGERLQSLYPETPVPLDHQDPYTLLIAVLLSAQCTDERVNQVTPALFEQASSPDRMVLLSVEAIRAIIRPCGLSPQKSKAIHRLSQILLDLYDGEVPADMAALEQLPGVGHKTASVVMAQAFGVPAFPVDTHIFRISNRTKFAPGKNVLQVEKKLLRVIPDEFIRDSHHWLILHGRYICTARKPRCGACVISDLCEFKDKTELD